MIGVQGLPIQGQQQPPQQRQPPNPMIQQPQQPQQLHRTMTPAQGQPQQPTLQVPGQPQQPQVPGWFTFTAPYNHNPTAMRIGTPSTPSGLCNKCSDSSISQRCNSKSKHLGCRISQESAISNATDPNPATTDSYNAEPTTANTKNAGTAVTNAPDAGSSAPGGSTGVSVCLRRFRRLCRDNHKTNHKHRCKCKCNSRLRTARRTR
ncbi:hypothetical protein BKA70DRAFT_885138 [Coprinopsis sp. MPI-PUGE-AT-0042]|nr:hypothetical protein BKA70DRAFT_885138 [Coprinopsis sp. MPI-PUGE-AT-0042]